MGHTIENDLTFYSREHCVLFLLQNVTDHNCIELLHLARLHIDNSANWKKLSDMCWIFLRTKYIRPESVNDISFSIYDISFVVSVSDIFVVCYFTFYY